ncbi:rRNA pseudouridine synthase [Paenibacillus sp. 1011MAR3C5]|uniref:pseudouridine synthase n=1 Tax=Paenibacillus sp. 1011MAR3C5 TaxID=1675787 RepID=UPI000E6C1EF8|nr:pseudouridine synthase [Paenibacillus sp. 1011MAR3C5]RJE89834.1 rRNA pseudouridine synthase [Paenibacillus sp. 1011MAR3C5]
MAEKLRIDKLLAHMGFGTRSEIKRAVKMGKVAVDGKVVKDSGLIVAPAEHTVTYEGETVIYRDVIYLMMNKPQGVISATEDGRERTVIDLLAPEDRLLNPFPVGRLDKDTVGLLLLTNNGQLAHELLSPRKHVDKTYEALVLGNVNEDDVKAFQEGVTLDDGYETLPARLQVLSRSLQDVQEDSSSVQAGEQASAVQSLIRLTIQEGKFHQVKRMFEAVDKTVLTLKRVSMGPLTLDEYLPEGHYRELTLEEVELLKAHRGSGK